MVRTEEQNLFLERVKEIRKLIRSKTYIVKHIHVEGMPDNFREYNGIWVQETDKVDDKIDNHYVMLYKHIFVDGNATNNINFDIPFYIYDFCNKQLFYFSNDDKLLAIKDIQYLNLPDMKIFTEKPDFKSIYDLNKNAKDPDMLITIRFLLLKCIDTGLSPIYVNGLNDCKGIYDIRREINHILHESKKSNIACQETLDILKTIYILCEE